MRYMRYTAYVCMFGRRGKGAEISLMGVRFFEIAIPLAMMRGDSELELVPVRTVANRGLVATTIYVQVSRRSLLP